MQLTLASPDSCRRLREALERANYTGSAITDVLGDEELPKRMLGRMPRLLYRTRGGTLLETLIRLFMMNVPVEATAVRRALEPEDPDAWVAPGVLERSGDCYQSALRFWPLDNLVLASDHREEVSNVPRSDFVLGVTNSAVTLSYCTLRRRVRKTLDVGSGCGVLAFLAAPHSERVVGVDLNPRAVAMAAFNARLNGIANAEFLEGDCFHPVREQKFDLITSNPPYMISPGVRYVYRDGGMEGDGFCRRLVCEAPQYLEEGGFCQISCEWAHIRGQDWRERLAEWFRDTGCDVWVLRISTKDISKYAEEWIRDTEPEDRAVGARLFQEWTAYYESENIEAISTGIITMRRSSGRANWFQTDDAPPDKVDQLGNYLLLRFELGDFLERAQDDAVLLDSRLRVSPDLHLIQECQWSPGTWSIVNAHLRLAGSMPYKGGVDPWSLGLIMRCDGQRSLRELLAELAAASHADLEKIAPGCLAVVRKLVERGFLVP